LIYIKLLISPVKRGDASFWIDWYNL